MKKKRNDGAWCTGRGRECDVSVYYISPTPFFTDYDKMNVVIFSYFGYNNTFSLWNY